MRNCRKELILWCGCKLVVIVVRFWELCNLEELGFKRICVLELFCKYMRSMNNLWIRVM